MERILFLILSFLRSIFAKKEAEPVSGDTLSETEIEEEETHTEEPIIEEKTYKNMVILLDNGHASTTAGKRSPVLPDGTQFFEYEFNRDIVKRIAKKLAKLGIEFRILVPEIDVDVPLSERAARANKYCAEYGAGNCFFISVHANAGSNGKWQKGRGWSVYTTKGDTNSDKYATILYEEAEKLLPGCGMTLRKDISDGDPDFEENFTVIYKTKCPAVLTENLFMDNMTDVLFLMSEGGREIIADIHVNAIKRICAA